MAHTPEEDARYFALLEALAATPAIQRLKDVPQHKGSTTYAHCLHVAKCAWALAGRWRWRVDARRLALGALLHDYYLYDTETMPYSDYRHALIHPKLALKNAEALFPLTDKERNIILSHMWPLPGAPLPRCREAWLICTADKLCALREMRAGRKRLKKNRQ